MSAIGYCKEVSMDLQRKSLHIGAAVIAAAVLLRLLSSGFFQPLLSVLEQPKVMSFLLYLETGRVVREASGAELTPIGIESPPPDAQPTEDTEPAAEPVVFTPADAENIKITYNCSYRPDIGQMLLAPLRWNLTDGQPAVLILHTHATESYTQTAEDTYAASSSFRTLDESKNMISIGDEVARVLEENGISVIHDRQLHDYPSYNGSYDSAQAAMEEYFAQYPTIRLVLDLHRDAAENENGQVATYAQVSGQDSAQLMLVLGSDAGGYEHPYWEQTFSLGMKLQALLERQAPGICRSTNFTYQRYNQQLWPNTILVEVGTAGNTRAEALVAARALAQSIVALAHGAGS